MTVETIKNYTGTDAAVKGHVEALEVFIGDMDNSELTDDSTIDTSDAVTALNGLTAALAAKDADIAYAREQRRQWQDASVADRAEAHRLRADLAKINKEVERLKAKLKELREALNAETERCAQIAETYHLKEPEFSGPKYSIKVVGEVIAKQIRPLTAGQGEA